MRSFSPIAMADVLIAAVLEELESSGDLDSTRVGRGSLIKRSYDHNVDLDLPRAAAKSTGLGL